MKIGAAKLKYTVTVTKDALVLKEDRRGGMEFKLARVSNDTPLLVVKKGPDTASDTSQALKPAKVQPTTEKAKIEEPTAGKKATWYVLFRSSDPTLWNKDVNNGRIAYGLAVRRAPEDLRFLKLTQIRCQKKDQDFVIVPITKARLLTQSDDGKVGWNGVNELSYKGYHLGVYTLLSGHWVKGNIEVIIPPPGKSCARATALVTVPTSTTARDMPGLGSRWRQPSSRLRW